MLHKISYFSEPAHCKNKIELSFSKYATTADWKSLRSLRSYSYLKNDCWQIRKLKNVPSGLNNLKTKVDKLDVYKSAPVPVDLKNLIDTVNNQVVKKTSFDELVKKVNAINTSWLITKNRSW